jgi:hypothetical protein
MKSLSTCSAWIGGALLLLATAGFAEEQTVVQTFQGSYPGGDCQITLWQRPPSTGLFPSAEITLSGWAYHFEVGYSAKDLRDEKTGVEHKSYLFEEYLEYAGHHRYESSPDNPFYNFFQIDGHDFSLEIPVDVSPVGKVALSQFTLSYYSSSRADGDKKIYTCSGLEERNP